MAEGNIDVIYPQYTIATKYEGQAKTIGGFIDYMKSNKLRSLYIGDNTNNITDCPSELSGSAFVMMFNPLCFGAVNYANICCLKSSSIHEFAVSYINNNTTVKDL